MTGKPSRLLDRLDAAIAAAKNVVIADCLRAERAAYLARQGRLDEAKEVLAALHERHDARPRPETSAWLSLAEGLVIHFSEMGTGAHDKVQRAHALSAAAGLTPMHALSAAWLAQMDFTRLDIDALTRHVSESLHLAAPDQHAARSRASLVVAQALHLAGRMDLASPWYTRTRDHASAEGDDTAVSAMLHNMAAIRFDNLRQTMLTGQGDAFGGRHALMGLDSKEHYDRFVGASSLEVLNPIARARILSIQGNPTVALDLYREGESIGLVQGLRRLRSELGSDRAWCRIRVGQLDAARVDALAAESSILPETLLDDRAATHSRLALVWAALGDHEAARRHEQLAAQAWRAFGEVQVRIVELLGPMTELGLPKRPPN